MRLDPLSSCTVYVDSSLGVGRPRLRMDKWGANPTFSLPGISFFSEGWCEIKEGRKATYPDRGGK